MEEDRLPHHLQWWGKARPADSASPPFHPIAYHSLDVAAVVQALLAARRHAVRRGSGLLEVDEEDAIALCTALASLHDLGKFGNAFQVKVPALIPAPLRDLGRNSAGPSPHTRDGLLLWDRALAPSLAPRIWGGMDDVAIAPLVPGLFGHHGSPARANDGALRSFFEAPSVHAATDCATDLIATVLPVPLQARRPRERQLLRFSWWFSGILSLCDWVGSTQQWFSYEAPRFSVGEYWSLAQARAVMAIEAAGLNPPRAAELRSFRDLTGRVAPTPLQRWAATVSLPAGQLLFVVEDATGAGKTEAAQVLVHRLLAAGRASGAYWAMPTQATANAMYTRQAEAVSQLYEKEPGRRPSLMLAHAQSALNPAFSSTVLGGLGDPSPMPTEPNGEPDDLSSSAWCAAWLADDRRAAFLADVGVGTIDQALLGALPSRFNTIRLAGLAEKVLVVDEAHAYDAYTSEELRHLLKFQSALGGHAIVLSATLDHRRRQELRALWKVNAPVLRRGLFQDDEEGGSTSRVIETAKVPYPLATLVASDGTVDSEHAVEPASWSARRLSVRLVHELDVVIAKIESAAREGAAVVWIRNTVSSCIESARQLRERGVSCEVFHARFAQGDRQAREHDIMARFGKKSTPSERSGRVVVATQVIEQSLDIDFDVMVSDLAPIDLLVQRAGRLWRHRERNPHRPSTVSEELLVLSPDPSEPVEANWEGALLPGTRFVYPHAGVLWRTARAIASEGQFEVPARSRALIEAVYGSDECPPALAERADKTVGTENANRAVANYVCLKVDVGYNGSAAQWVSDLRAPTRLSEAQTTVRLARRAPDGSLEPWWRQADTPWKCWALSEVRVYSTRMPRAASPIERDRRAVERLKARWNQFEQDRVVVVLDPVPEADGTWEGRLMADGGSIRLGYSEAEGVVVTKG